jgi:hypothetical protein
MAQLFRPGADVLLRLILVAFVVAPFTLVGAFYVYAASPYHTGRGVTVEQPVPFSHQHHVGDLGIDCRFCHASVETSRFAGMPSTRTCMTCHSQIWTNAPMLAPVRDSLAKGTPLHWARVNHLPDYVYFDHSVHVAKGVACVTCHGPVNEMALMRQEKPLTMGFCLDCHRDPGRRLGPKALVFDTALATPDNGLVAARAYVRTYGVHTRNMTDCSVCHR